jgi:glycerol-3-phosphate dehydrogenase
MSGPTAISSMARDRVIDELERTRFDCVVIGGGITGAGIALEASLRGLSVALLEAEDFASGTSSRSSKLIHGGLRYLAMGDVGLVRETALERKQIFRLAPHLAERRWMVIPSRSRAGMLKLRVGIAAYERLGSVGAEDVHQNWSSAELAQQEPLLDRTRYPHACAYREYLTDDARLVLANLRGAVRRGARVLNRARVDAIPSEQGRAVGVEAVCSLSERRFRVNAAAVINAAGPWVEAVRGLEDGDAVPLLVLSKGIHIVLPAERVPVRNMVALAAQDSRTVFVIPRGGMVYMGTTDTPHPDGAQAWPSITASDVEYLLEPLPRYFGLEPVKLDEVTAAWAGLRPLIADPGKKTTEISRRDEVLLGPARVVSIAGGKLTGYRPMARRAIEEVARTLERRLDDRPQEEPLPGGDFDGPLERLAGSLTREFTLADGVALRLARLYGAEAALVAARGRSPLTSGTSVLLGEVDWAVQEEGATCVEDVLYRRTRAALYLPSEREALVQPIAERMQSLLDWTQSRLEGEVGAVRARLASETAFAGPGG